MHVGGVVAHHRIDAAEGVAVADEQDLERVGHRRRAAEGDGEGSEQGSAAVHESLRKKRG